MRRLFTFLPGDGIVDDVIYELLYWFFLDGIMKHRHYKTVAVVLGLIGVLFASSSVNAFTKGFEAISLHPATDGGPYFGIWGSENLDQLQWELGTLATYANRPFQLTQGGRRVRGILDHTLTQHVYGALGIFDRWLEMGFDVPIGWWLKFRDPNIATATTQREMAIGDVRVYLKSELLDIKKHRVGIALLPFISIPTGYGKYYFGNGGVAGGGQLVAEFEPVKRWTISLNSGIYARQRFTFRNIEKSHQFLLGMGTAVQLVDALSIAAEVASSTRLSGIYSEGVESPVEVRGGLKWAIANTGLLVNVGGGAGIIKGGGAPRYRIFGGLSFSPRRIKPRLVAPSLDVIRNAVVNFAFGSVVVASQYQDVLNRVADVMKEAESVKVMVRGYTDSIGNENYNKRVSEQRAESVKIYINIQGVEADRMQAVGLGESNPIGDNKTHQGRETNRRVDFSIEE